MISIRPALSWFLALLLLALISGCDRAPVSPATAAPAYKEAISAQPLEKVKLAPHPALFVA